MGAKTTGLRSVSDPIRSPKAVDRSLAIVVTDGLLSDRRCTTALARA
jgi:hypothetical protein